jgi:ferredoxin
MAVKIPHIAYLAIFYLTIEYPSTLMPTLTFSKQKRSLHLRENTELLRVPYLDVTVPLRFGCCQGECGTCAIKILSGAENLSPKTKQEQATLCRLRFNEHYRLACQCALRGDVVIDA